MPVTRAGMASGTADLQRDLGGAIMQSIFGALLTAGYAASVASQIAASDQQITDSTQSALTKSFASAEALAEQHPQYADAIVAGAKEAFLDGDDWAYTAGSSRSCSVRCWSSSSSRASRKKSRCSPATTPKTAEPWKR